ncbi:MAG: hypothetical protein M3Z92_01880 [Bacteroidota bacterium]|nr:hypothetical protein [Bacteroidota bacterium]
MKTIKIAIYLCLGVVFLNSCQKEYSVEGVVVPTGTWEFKDSLKQFLGNIDTAYIDSSNSTQELHLIGRSSDLTQTFHLHLFSDKFQTGLYKASLFQTSFTYSSGSNIIYQANQLIGEFIVNVTSYGNNNIAGTFSGSALDSTGKVLQLTQGKFTASLKQQGTTGGGISSGVLGDSSGNCKPVILNGAYSQGTALTASNTVQVEVTVAVPGTYTISSNTLNGVSFTKSGTFTSAGVQNVTLAGTGTPAATGNQIYTVSYGTAQCTFSINFGSASAGTLGGGGGNCTPFTVGGVYQQGIVLNQTNSVQLQVNVTTPGNYFITTNTVNGVSFSKSGTFASAGLQIVTLAGTGTPINSGAQTFTVTYGGSTCSFSITFLPGATPSGDYFPLTLNSNWTYEYVQGTSSDSVHTIVINYSPTINGNVYNTIAAYDVPSAGAFDSAYYRKPGGSYYQYADFSNYIPFDQNVSGEFIFLKDNVPVNSTWVSQTVSGTIGGLPVSGYIKMTLLAYAVPATVGSFNFPDIIKMQYEYFITGIPTPIETDERWFAKNVGEIYDSISSGGTTDNYKVGRFQIF